MVVARLFGPQPWLADRETISAYDRKLIHAILERMTEANAERVLSGYVKRAYFDYRNATKFLH
jgi:hypothetical protein